MATLPLTRTEAAVNQLGQTLKKSRFFRNNSHQTNQRLKHLGGATLALAAAQYSLGNADDFFEHKFITTAKSEDLADFYGTEGECHD